jgi:hypothetical protein
MENSLTISGLLTVESDVTIKELKAGRALCKLNIRARGIDVDLPLTVFCQSKKDADTFAALANNVGVVFVSTGNLDVFVGQSGKPSFGLKTSYSNITTVGQPSFDSIPASEMTAALPAADPVVAAMEQSDKAEENEWDVVAAPVPTKKAPVSRAIAEYNVSQALRAKGYTLPPATAKRHYADALLAPSHYTAERMKNLKENAAIDFEGLVSVEMGVA